MATTTAYSFANVAATLDGRNVSGLWDGDDTIMVEQGADQGTGIVGADGSALFSLSTDTSARITLRLQHTSPTHRLLLQKMKRQKALGATSSAFPFDVKDTASGEGGSADKCYIVVAPSVSNGKNAAVREWVLWAGQFEMAVTNG